MTTHPTAICRPNQSFPKRQDLPQSTSTSRFIFSPWKKNDKRQPVSNTPHTPPRNERLCVVHYACQRASVPTPPSGTQGTGEGSLIFRSGRAIRTKDYRSRTRGAPPRAHTLVLRASNIHRHGQHRQALAGLFRMSETTDQGERADASISENDRH